MRNSNFNSWNKSISMIAFGIGLFFAINSNKTFAQSCNTIPVEEAIVNGDFESGDVGFTSGYRSIKNTPALYGPWYTKTHPANPTNQYFAASGDYLVHKQGTVAGNAYHYLNGDFDDDGVGLYDHTYGDSTGSYYMMDASGNTSLAVWQQSVTVIPNQTYYFSAWVASLATSSPPDIRFEISTNGGTTWSTLGASSNIPTGVRQWNQFYETWFSGTNTTLDIRLMNANPNSGSGNDLALDDISFTNGCQSIQATQPDLGPDLTLCRNNGTITLDPGFSTSTSGPDRRFYWYEGSSSPQTELVNSSQTQNTLTVTAGNTYRVCITDDGGCGMSSTIVISDTLDISLPDIELCGAPSDLVDMGVSLPSAAIASVDWTGASGNVSNTQTYTVTTGGVHNLSITSAGGYNCNVNENFTVSSSLPIPVSTPIDYCPGTDISASVTNVSSAEWFDAASGGTSLGTGLSYTYVSPPAGGFTLYVENAETTPLPNTALSSGGSQYGPGHNEMSFDALTGIEIVSVKANSQTWQGGCDNGVATQNVTVELLQGGVLVPGMTTNFSFNCGGTHTIPLGFKVPAGTGYSLRYTGGNYFPWTPDWSPPLDLNMRNNSSFTHYGDQAIMGGSLYDWVVNESPGCSRVPIVFNDNCPCTPPADNPAINSGSSTLTVCQGDEASLSILSGSLTAGLDYQWQADLGSGFVDFGAVGSVPGGGTVTLTGITQAGDYRLVIANAGEIGGACDKNSSSVLITINPTPTTVANSNDADNTICDGDNITLTGSGATTYSWTGGVTDGVAFAPGATATYTVTGTTSGCSSTDDITITVNSVPTTVANSNDADNTICDGDNITLTGSGATTYSWTGGVTDGASFAPGATATYTVTGTTSGCSSTDDITITVNSVPTTVANSNDADNTICDGDNITLTGSGATTYSWTGGVTDGASFAPGATATYTVTGTTSGCSSTDDITITVNAIPTTVANSNDADNTICDGDNITLTGSGATTYSWTGGVTDGASFAPGATATYTVTGTTSGCSSTDDITITVNPIPTTVANSNDADNTICDGDNITLSGSGATTYSWTGGVTDGASFAPGATATYTVTGTTNGCSSTDDITITVNPTPVANISGSNSICNNGTDDTDITITLTTGTGPFDFTYNGDNGTGNVNVTGASTGHTITVSSDEDFTLVSLVDANGCTAQAADLTGNALITYFTDPDTSNFSVICDPTNDPVTPGQFNYIISFDITGGDAGSYSVTGATGSESGGTWTSDPIDESVVTNLSVTDGNNCNPISINNIQRVCSCPEVATLSVSGGFPSTLCELGTPTTSELTITFTGGAPGQLYNFDVENIDSLTTPVSETGYNGDTPYTFAITQGGRYRITNLSGSCSGSSGADVTIDYHDSPAANIAPATQSICDNGAQATIDINLTAGTGPFSIDYSGSTTGAVNEPAFNGAQFQFNTMNDETFTLTGLTDANGCTAKVGDLTGSAQVIYFTDPDTSNYQVTCDPTNDPVTPGQFNYIISFDITGGDAGSYSVTGATGTESGGTWTSDPIDESIITNLSLTDGNGCNPLAISNIQQQCSCPEVATLSVSGGFPSTLCELGTPTTSELTVTFTGGAPGQLYNFDIENIDSLTSVSETGYNGDTPYTLSITQGGRYRITNLSGSCSGSSGADVTIDYHDSPAANIAPSTQSICDNGAQATIDINLTAGTGPFSIDYSGSTTGAVNEPAFNGAQFQFNTMNDETFTLVGLTDANGCSAKASDLTGSAVVTYFTDPDTSNYQVTCDPTNDPVTPGQFNYIISFDITGGDAGSYSVTGATGTESGGTWTSDPIDESIITNLSLTDGNGCNPLAISNIQRTCSCPTTASASLASGMICDVSSTTLDVSFANGTGPFEVSISGASTSGPITSAGPTEQFTVSAEGTYNVEVYNVGDDCYANALPVTLGHFENPTSTVSGGGTICDNGSDQATVSISFPTGTGPFTFDVSDGSTTTTVSTSNNPESINTMIGGTYSVTALSDANCTGTPDASNVNVTLVTPPNPNVNDPGTSFCDGQGSYTLSASDITSGNSYEWLLNGNPTGVIDQDITIGNLNESGTYTVRETSSICGQVTSSTSSMVTVNSIPTVDAGDAPEPFMQGESATLSASSNGTTFSWSPAADALTPSSLTTVITPLQSQYFTLTASNGNCSDSASVYVTVLQPIVIPNAFTPNGDKENDTWEIDGLDTYPGATVQIFNRWGSPVYKVIGNYIPWDGTRGGGIMPTHTYYYIIDLGIEGLPVYTGSVTLVR